MMDKKTGRYDLRLDRSCIFIATSQSAGSTASITGRFCLSFPETAWVKRIKVRVRGLLRIPPDGFMVTEDRQTVTHEKEQLLASSETRSSFQVPAGYYEFLFDVPLSSNIMETVTGSEHNYHTYQVDAIIERRYWKDIVVSQPLSIYKLPEAETSHLTTDFPLTVEGQSDQNIRHCTSIPNSTIPFGSIFSVECGFAVPSKNIKLSTLTLEVTEKHNLRLSATAAQAALCNINSVTSSRAHTVFKETHTLTPESGLASCAGTEWCISTRVCLPRSLDSCSQSVMTKKIKISHLLVVTAEFQDENGRLLDKIVNTIPFSIYIAPSVLGPDGSICGQAIESNTSPPPPYGKHMCHVRLLESTEVGDQQHRFQLLEPAPSYDLAVGREPPVHTFVV